MASNTNPVKSDFMLCSWDNDTVHLPRRLVRR
jgi:hypothetical protein